MRLAIRKCEDSELRALETLLARMRQIVESTGNRAEEFFETDNAFHDLIEEMGKNPLADKINRVVRTLTHAMRYETVKTMIETGRGEELVDAHARLLEILKTKDVRNLDEDVRGTYFSEVFTEG